MKWRILVGITAAVCLHAVSCEQHATEEHRDRRQSNNGAPLQFGIARAQLPPVQLVSRGLVNGPPPTFQLLQAFRADERSIASTAAPQVQQVLRTTQQPTIARTRSQQHIIPTASPRVQQQQPVHRQIQQQRGRLQANHDEIAEELAEKEEEELEEDKPDRLTELLPLSKFDCGGRGTGYYADEELDCEIFHYCQAGAKHSWICPEGFTFHQVHLICMPPGGDNICKKSSQFHFVNEYLYRPINAEEAQTKPNVTLRYADRYYPETYNQRNDEEEDFLPHPQRQRLPAPSSSRPVQSPPRPSIQPATILRTAPQHPFQQRTALGNQVFHSPEEVNIPLQHRRPVAASNQQRAKTQNFGSEEEYEYDEQTYRQG
ncbi:hypothetical protein J437_LFUL014064 [Ladona fulva]|uniref:Chitin-binding type-2 domain-containing protein n=1 Tax=Ladona fulva TaxID=123851 RepID=A0A8K0PAT6_LADFU|nr:hypothetical protein J437_LFUL014064 [Ladona fulva]